ncbi:hypothetical protein HK096_005076, partial [Nowakowskiella sp. JEL0078]
SLIIYRQTFPSSSLIVSAALTKLASTTHTISEIDVTWETSDDELVGWLESAFRKRSGRIVKS